MKVIYIIICILGHFSVIGQLDSLGIDNRSTLTKSEATYFNNRFEKERGQFSFEDKVILFLTGPNGSKRITKGEYFDDVRRSTKQNYDVVSRLFIITGEEQKNSGSDAIVTAWVKILTDRKRRKMIQELKTSR